MTVAEILAEVRGYGAAHAVVTGGEPMIVESVAELTRSLDMHVTIETAGTVYRSVKCI